MIIDSTQSFFSIPVNGVTTLYSCRKFFRVPDGAYLYLDNVEVSDIQFDCSGIRISHILKRIDYRANEANEGQDVLIDVTERHILLPSDPDFQKEFYSGNKKPHD